MITKKNVNKVPKSRKKTVRKRMSKAPVYKARNGGTMTESAFWQMVRATLRSKTRFWLPRLNALKAAKRPSQSLNKRLKWEYQCSECKRWLPQSVIEVHHSIEVGSLLCAEDLPRFVENLFSETGWVCLCKDCHKKEHI